MIKSIRGQVFLERISFYTDGKGNGIAQIFYPVKITSNIGISIAMSVDKKQWWA